ncbi:MAG: hypothetical protein U9N59_12050 [Campylobacterota bacterium]|nr:hypothetical protein [Campylobacterota bacterium]
MKHLIKFIIFITVSMQASDFKIAANTMNVQDCEGGGISLFYSLNEKLLLETSYNTFYIRGVQDGSTSENWNEYNTQRLGVRYYLKSYANNEIKLFVSAGAEHIYHDTSHTTKKPDLNTYGLLGLDFLVNDNFNITFAFGSGGKGPTADKINTDPNYAHGFNSVVGIEYTF